MNTGIDYAFEVVAQRLPGAGIDFLMIGGHAVNHYGYVRATQDVDFMIAGGDANAVRTIMRNAGFTNISVHDTVTFFNQPGSPLRIDFLGVDERTMAKLLENAVATEYFAGYEVKVPQLKDLVAMKLFALRSGSPKRKDKDFPDIVHLAIEHDWDLEADLRPLCDRFGSDALYRDLCIRIEELRSA